MQGNGRWIKSSFLMIGLLILANFSRQVRADALRDHLSVFFEFHALDSVVALEQKSATALQVTVADGATGETRNLVEDVGTKPMQKLLTEANDLGLKTLPLSPVTEEKKNATLTSVTPSSEIPKAIAPPTRSLSSQRKNRMWYMINQTVLSTYVYGISIPLAFDAHSARVQIATPMLVAPFSFGSHFWFAKDRAFEDSHLKGTTYLSMASLYASYALPFALMPVNSERFRVASMLSLAAYPAGVYGGYLLGDQYVDLPGRVDTQEKFALGFGIMGFFSPFLYFEDTKANIQTIVRLSLGQSVGMAAMGHFLANHYRTGENIPNGVNTGIASHSVLGAALGIEVAAIADANSVRPWMGAALLGGTLGFMEALYYYKNSYDSQERGLYNTFGALGGTLFGTGLAWLFVEPNSSNYSKKVTITSLLVGSTLLGYIATNILTDGMEDRAGIEGKPNWTDRLSFNPIPFPEPQMRDQEVYYRYRMPGISYRF